LSKKRKVDDLLCSKEEHSEEEKRGLWSKVRK